MTNKPFIFRPNPDHFDLSLSVQAEVVCDCTVKCCKEMNWLKRVLGAKIPGVVIIQSSRFPSLGASHDLGGNLPSTLQGRTQRFHTWSASEKADSRVHRIKKKDPCTQELHIFFSGICLTKLYLLTNPAALPLVCHHPYHW